MNMDRSLVCCLQFTDIIVFLFQFEEMERRRMKAEQLRQELKHKKQWEDLKARNESGEDELKQLQVRDKFKFFI